MENQNITFITPSGEPKKKTAHTLHAVLSIFTLGMWLPVWIIISMARA